MIFDEGLVALGTFTSDNVLSFDRMDQSSKIATARVNPAEAPRIDNVPKWSGIEKPSFTMPCNVTGFPAISICTGFGAGGLPVSMQLAGKPFTEPTLFRAAHAYETAMPWRSKRPAMAA